MIRSPLSPTSQSILQLLIENDELYGLEMVRLNGLLKRGTIYVTLGRLEGDGLIESREVKQQSGQGPPRRVYKITGHGRQIHEAALQFQQTAGMTGLGIIGGAGT